MGMVFTGIGRGTGKNTCGLCISYSIHSMDHHSIRGQVERQDGKVKGPRASCPELSKGPDTKIMYFRTLSSAFAVDSSKSNEKPLKKGILLPKIAFFSTCHTAGSHPKPMFHVNHLDLHRTGHM